MALMKIALIVLCVAQRAVLYNIETEKVVVLAGAVSSSEFGFSVAFAPAPGWEIKKRNGEMLDYVLLVGAPNMTRSNITGYGDVMRCNNPDGEQIPCTAMSIKDERICDKLKKSVSKKYGKTSTDCEMNQRLGSTIAVNRNIGSTSSIDEVAMVKVCAPSWKNVWDEWSPQYYQVYPVGMCFSLHKDLSQAQCSDINDRSCFPFWPSKYTSFVGGQPVNVYAQAGMSATFTKDGRSEIIGAPGVSSWKGNLLVVKDDLEILNNRKENTFYAGYALAAGNFGVNGATIATGVPNFYTSAYGHVGKVDLFSRDGQQAEQILFGSQRRCDDVRMADMQSILDKQVGTKFGAAIVAIDINMDGIDELLIGAPLYTSKRGPEEGRVFVYRTVRQKLCGPVAILSGSQIRDSRFGTSLATGGDLNGDSLTDVFVGAPYEDEHRGAVYLYHGTPDSGVQEKYSQRLAGRDIDSGLRTFGWSLYGDTDVDTNQYPDLAVGAYASSQAVVFRTRPIVNIFCKVTIQPRVISLNASKMNCSVAGKLCVKIQLAISARGKGLTEKMVVEVNIKTDTLLMNKNGKSRVKFNDTKLSERMHNYTLNPNNPGTWEYELLIEGHSGSNVPSDLWTALVIEGNFRLIQNSLGFANLNPVPNNTIPDHFSDQVYFDRACDVEENCTSDLNLTVNVFLVDSGKRRSPYTSTTAIYLGGTETLEMEVDVTNLHDTAYNVNFTAMANVDLQDIRLLGSSVESRCKDILIDDPLNPSQSQFDCLANNKLDNKENIRAIGIYDVTSDKLMPGTLDELKSPVTLSVKASQVNRDTDTQNNVFKVDIPVQLKYDLVIRENKALYAQVLYKSESKSTREITLMHQFILTNHGPSFLPMTYVNISVPISKAGVEIAKLGIFSASCLLVSENFQGLTTTQVPTMSSTQTTRIAISTPKQQRKRRDVEDEDTPTASKSVKTSDISWDNSEVVQIACKCNKLNKHESQTFNVTIKIFEKSIAQTGDREVRYGTKATVTDPSIWYGGKVVPFQTTMYAEKWTSMVLEQASVSSEVNIWIIIGAMLGAIALLVIITFVLWKCGFFSRKKQTDIQRWRQESLYKRRSQASRGSTRVESGQPYDPLNENKPKTH